MSYSVDGLSPSLQFPKAAPNLKWPSNAQFRLHESSINIENMRQGSHIYRFFLFTTGMTDWTINITSHPGDIRLKNVIGLTSWETSLYLRN